MEKKENQKAGWTLSAALEGCEFCKIEKEFDFTKFQENFKKFKQMYDRCMSSGEAGHNRRTLQGAMQCFLAVVGGYFGDYNTKKTKKSKAEALIAALTDEELREILAKRGM